jgi:hypothetical protein
MEIIQRPVTGEDLFDREELIDILTAVTFQSTSLYIIGTLG